MIRRRLRLRYRKQGDLRWISHKDLLRTLERLFRRAGLRLGMSEGFHPKPRMTFPLALAVGVEGLDEVMELELAEERDAQDVLDAVCRAAPPGLVFTGAQVRPTGAPKVQVSHVVCQIDVPEQRRAAAQQRIEAVMAADSLRVDRADRATTIDLRHGLADLRLDGGTLSMVLHVAASGMVRPREVLEALGLADLESLGHTLVRSQVRAIDEPPVSSGELPSSPN